MSKTDNNSTAWFNKSDATNMASLETSINLASVERTYYVLQNFAQQINRLCYVNCMVVMIKCFQSYTLAANTFRICDVTVSGVPG